MYPTIRFGKNLIRRRHYLLGQCICFVHWNVRSVFARCREYDVVPDTGTRPVWQPAENRTIYVPGKVHAMYIELTGGFDLAVTTVHESVVFLGLAVSYAVYALCELLEGCADWFSNRLGRACRYVQRGLLVLCLVSIATLYHMEWQHVQLSAHGQHVSMVHTNTVIEYSGLSRR